jgi:hypothetical protein
MSGQDVENDMPEKGQQAIVDAVTLHEKGIVMTEDAVGRVPQFQWKILQTIQLADFLMYIVGKLPFNLIATGHPIWNDMPSSFTTSREMMVVLMAAFPFGKIQPIALLGSTPLGDIHGVIARDDEGVGRIVQIAHAAHFYPDFDWNQDANVTKMMINSIKWVAKLI